MNTEVAVVGKKNGHTALKKPAVESKPTAVVEKPKETKKESKPKEQQPEKVSGWSIARSGVLKGQSDAAVRKAVEKYLAENTSAEVAMSYFINRVAGRMLFRAHRAAKTKKGGANGSK